MENDFQDFMNFRAVVEIRKHYRNDLYNFIKLIIDMGIFNNEITYFINAMGLIENFENGSWKKVELANNLAINGKLELLDSGYTDSNFWHLVEINCGYINRVCIEYQYGKGFTFGKKEDYINYDNTIKILNVEDLIRACGKEDLFNLGYKETSFLNELTDKKDKDLAIHLTDFCEWYEWELVKYGNGLYNILDIQTEELDFDSNVELKEVIERVFNRMVDYYTDEGEHEEISLVKKEIDMFKKLGKQYNLCSNERLDYLDKWLEEEIEYLG